MVRFGTPGQNVDPLSYADSRLAGVPAIQAPRRPTVNDKKFPMWCEWRVNKDATAPAGEGEFWKLIRFESNGDATWVQIDIGSGGPGVDDLRDQVDAQVGPGTTGLIDIDGAVIGNAGNPSGIPLETIADAVNSTLDVQIQVAAAITGAPADKNDAGICSFDDTSFSVDANGYVTLSGGPGPSVDSVTGDDAEVVGADAAGNIDWQGSTVANATNAKPLYINGTPASNLMEPEIQVSAAITGAPGDKNDAGLASFNDTHFSVDADGYVSLIGGGIAIDTISGDDSNAVTPDGNGNFNLAGVAVANATHAKPIYFKQSGSANTVDLDVQVAAGVASAPSDKNDAGISSFKADDFDVTTHGFVQTKTLTVGVKNLGISYSGGTFTVHGFDGTALSATNPAYVTLQNDGTPGQLVTIPVTANQTFIDDAGASEIIGNTFGTTAGAAWGYTMPFFLYAVSNSDEDAIAFMISRFPSLGGSPAAARIGAPDDAVSNDSASFWSLENIDETEYESNPCLCIGSFRMTKSDAANDDWTVTALSAKDGIGRFQNGNSYSYDPILTGVGTAGTGTYTQQDGLYSFDGAPHTVALLLRFKIALSAHTGAGRILISSPFRFGSASSYGVVWITGGTSVPAGTDQIILESSVNDFTMSIRTTDYGTTQSYCDVDATSTYYGQLYYRGSATV